MGNDRFKQVYAERAPETLAAVGDVARAMQRVAEVLGIAFERGERPGQPLPRPLVVPGNGKDEGV